MPRSPGVSLPRKDICARLPEFKKTPLELREWKEKWSFDWRRRTVEPTGGDDEATKHVFSSKLIITTPQTGMSIPQPSYTYEATIRPSFREMCDNDVLSDGEGVPDPSSVNEPRNDGLVTRRVSWIISFVCIRPYDQI
ncbi:hypothetical protein WN944_022170 [Citrus x changshan-huyou]|uniref:Uncharacterized protein n=1 Tax=Citrus x changshan-huyou TaxID=2935761 RepID=A0AAP0N0S6_9ROSI